VVGGEVPGQGLPAVVQVVGVAHGNFDPIHTLQCCGVFCKSLRGMTSAALPEHRRRVYPHDLPRLLLFQGPVEEPCPVIKGLLVVQC